SALLIYHFVTVFGLILLWISLLVFFIGFQYQKNNTYFLKNKTGKISLFKKVFFLPYLFVYWFFWRFFRKNRITIEVIPNLYVSSKLSQKDFEHFQTENTIIVYDLSAELEEINIIKSNHNYHFVPFLDVGTYDLKTTQNLVNQISDRYNQISKNEKILIH